MTDEDVPAVLDLWFGTEGLLMRSIDRERSIQRFLDRNPGLSFVAQIQGETGAAVEAPGGAGPLEDGGHAGGAVSSIVGAVICGHDGRRGYLHHLAVASSYRHRGLGRALADRCLLALEGIGITKCHLFVRADNPEARAFWERVGWHIRDDTHMLSRNLTDDLDA